MACNWNLQRKMPCRPMVFPTPHPFYTQCENHGPLILLKEKEIIKAKIADMERELLDTERKIEMLEKREHAIKTKLKQMACSQEFHRHSHRLHGIVIRLSALRAHKEYLTLIAFALSKAISDQVNILDMFACFK